MGLDNRDHEEGTESTAAGDSRRSSEPDDNARSWAALAHQQRYAAHHYAEPLILPVVLHLASKVDGYILPPDQVTRCQDADE
ncbi:RNAseH domain-containing protein [Saccharopolyspora sp. 6T]|uniref:RNaseH domain-containing protein n=1 Tax=Saccharopolyspora sp. 6T TaxID=2877238 RepID=UPI001CD3836D|nr:RNAseH domain-containing protein [Saccharopolyspora sp. 6T]MCA1283272.1 RNAseH domain-containing protein [Saccharopolyspora sp. 7B]